MLTKTRYTDHLNTPRLVADATGTTVWRWDQAEPFGNNPADENPSGLGAFDLPLRLPGQRYDQETALHYNYFRDYDPSLGRYGESDPIGLDAGPNTFFYALGNPLKFTDPLGLKGCGSGFWEFAVPNNPPDYHHGRDFPFERCCDMHDACYEDCERTPTKFDCDFRFWNCMTAKCSRYRSDVRIRCEDLASKYAGAAANMKRAQNSFDDARAKCCK